MVVSILTNNFDDPNSNPEIDLHKKMKNHEKEAWATNMTLTRLNKINKAKKYMEQTKVSQG